MIKIGKWFLVIFTINIYFLSSSNAKIGFNVKAELKSKVVGIEEDFSYTLVAEMTKDIQLKVQQPVWPKDIEFSHSSSSEQTNMQIINGTISTSRVKKISYTLKPKRLGSILLPSIKVFANNKTYQTKAVRIKVVKEAQARKNTPSRQFNPIDSFFNNSFSFQNKNKKKSINEKDIFIKLELSKNSLFLSEQVVLKWFLYTRLNISSIKLVALPNLKHFWKKDLDSKKPKAEQVSINNKLYQKSLLFSYVVSPLKVGKLNIDPLKVQAQILDNSGFGFYSNSVKLSSRNKVISVSELPKLIKKTNFSGAIGEFQLDDKINTNNIQKGKAFIWEVTVQGLGNLGAFNLSELNLDSKLELYDIQEKSEMFLSGVSRKKIELLVIPKVEGNIPLPIIELVAFNPYTKIYYSLFSQKKEIFVKSNPLYLNSTSKNTSADFDKKSKNIIKKSISANSETPFFEQINKLKKEKKDNWFIFNKYFILILILFLISFVLFLCFKRFNNREKNKLLILKNKFLNIEKNILLIDEKKAARELIDLTYWAVEEVKGKKYKFLSLEKMVEELPLSYQNKVGKDLIKLLTFCETVAFSKETPKSLKKALNKVSIQLHSCLRMLLKYN